jgi:hypothetical protein
MFYLDVSKVYLGVAHVANGHDACFNRMFQVFHLYVANISSEYFKSRSSIAHAANGTSDWRTLP